MATSIRASYNYQINDFATPTNWNTNNIFDATYVESEESPIDTFFHKLLDLNKLILDTRNLSTELTNMHQNGTLEVNAFNTIGSFLNNTSNISPVHTSLILLGYISAVESYFREIIRRIVIIDDVAKRACELKSIAFGAALFHKKEMLPEALLESVTFISKENIKDVLKQFLGITGAPFPTSVDESLIEFENVCQLRHCIVHRFGKLGANNAIKLGLDAHGVYIEKPIKLDYTAIQKVAQVSFNVVKEINQFLWQFIMMRQIAELQGQNNWKKKTTPIKWTWDLRKDKKLFKLYFDTFAFLQGNNPPGLLSAYSSFRIKYNTLAN